MPRLIMFRVVALAAALASLAGAAQAESIERGFDMDVFTRYETQKKKSEEDGLVLEHIRDGRGNVAGKFTLGGNGREQDPFYDFGATQNIRAARENEMGGGILNLRVSF